MKQNPSFINSERSKRSKHGCIYSLLSLNNVTFLLKASVKDTGFLYAAIHHRLVALRGLCRQGDGGPAESQADAVLPRFNGESCDEDEEEITQVTKSGSGK